MVFVPAKLGPLLLRAGVVDFSLCGIEVQEPIPCCSWTQQPLDPMP